MTIAERIKEIEDSIEMLATVLADLTRLCPKHNREFMLDAGQQAEERLKSLITKPYEEIEKGNQ